MALLVTHLLPLQLLTAMHDHQGQCVVQQFGLLEPLQLADAFQRLGLTAPKGGLLPRSSWGLMCRLCKQL